MYTYFLMFQEASKALEIGSSVLLPPVLDRMDILLSILPEEPANIATLTAGQVQQGWYYCEQFGSGQYVSCKVEPL